MRIVILDGRTEQPPGTAELPSLLSQVLHNAVVRAFKLVDMDLDACLGCFGCWTNTPGECVISDKGRDIAEASVNADVLVLISPVTFGGYNSILKTALDRLLPNLLPLFVKIKGETHHAARYDKQSRLLALGLNPANLQQEALFSTMVERNAINFHCLSHASHFSNTSEGPVSNEDLSKTIKSQLTSWGVTI